MYTNLKYKWAVIFGVLLLGVLMVTGIPKSKDELMANIQKNLRLGLDLKGGSHLVVQLQVQDAFKAEADLAIERLRSNITPKGVTFTAMDRNDPQTIETADSVQINVKGVPIDKVTVLRQAITEVLPEWVMSSVNSTDFVLKLKTSEALRLRREVVDRAVQTLDRRINALGLSESSVSPRGRAGQEAEIMIQMPGVDDPAHVKSIISTAAVLELAEVKAGPFSTRAEAESNKPFNSRVVAASPRNGEGQGFYVLARTPVVTGRDLKNSRPQRSNDTGGWETSFVLSAEAGKRFGNFTEQHINDRLAIVLDGAVTSAPTIQGRIEDQGVINNIGDEQAATDLALVLKSGSLPAGLKYLQETTVGPSLGADSIRSGIIAGLVGLVAVVAAMLIYYRGAGVNATIALILNAILLIGAVSYFEAVLTLPGIAGIILTIGMAVDSNVLIFERIREELQAGKAIPAAIEAGFDRAFITIIDTHVTTVFSCAILFLFGSGPIKGFAVTLVIGLIVNVFTAVFVSRTLFQWSLNRNPQMRELSI
ncbi:MAG: protein translocase subunit SecD [Bryobacterales bacterium]|nr:protein translocase subunit SecD [Bryobacterales bacterium]